MALTYIVPVRYCMNRGSANGAPAGGAFLVDIPTEAVAEVRGPNNSSLLPPLAALVVVAVGSAAVRVLHRPTEALQTVLRQAVLSW